ncbi:AraC family transcriptional regulator [Coraliomargarita sp. W4R72]
MTLPTTPTTTTTTTPTTSTSNRIKLDFCFKVSVEKDSLAASDHSHEALELIYFLSGRGTTEIAGQTYKIQRGAFCIVPQGVIHNQHSDTTITSVCLGIYGSGLEESQGIWADSTGEIRNFVLNLVEELSARKTAYSMITEGYLISIIGLVQRAIKANSKPDRNQALIAKALQIIESKAGNLSIDDIAGQLFVSKDYLRHIFTHNTGQSPMQTLIAARIEHAKTLLLDPSLSIGQVAEKCGFDSPYYFSRLFKKVVGRSPQAFRKG